MTIILNDDFIFICLLVLSFWNFAGSIWAFHFRRFVFRLSEANNANAEAIDELANAMSAPKQNQIGFQQDDEGEK